MHIIGYQLAFLMTGTSPATVPDKASLRTFNASWLTEYFIH